MSSHKLFEPVHIGTLQLSNRIAMAPMTRSRASADGVPGALTPLYYAQRATAGLIITEGTAPSASGYGYARTPGIYSAPQIESWKKVTHAIHEKGCKTVVQIMHVGRIAHSANRTIGDPPVAPSAIRAAGQMWTDSQGMQPNDLPRALDTAEIPKVIEEFAAAARNAFTAGFDGVELHAASGYLPNQFLSTNTNHRDDQYGGPVNNRIRFVVEAMEAMIAVAGAGKVGIKISPAMQFNDINDENPEETYSALAEALNSLPLAYLHMMRWPGFDFAGKLRKIFKGSLLLGGGYDKAQAMDAVDSGAADVVVFGSKYVANPDLVKRLELDAAFNAPDQSTFYTPGEKGYTDYPTL